MARWRDDQPMSARLGRFALADWTGADPEAAVAAWSQAARAWIEEHPDKPLPWGDGGPVDLLCAVIRLRLLADCGVLASRVLDADDLSALVATRWSDMQAVWLAGNGHAEGVARRRIGYRTDP